MVENTMGMKSKEWSRRGWLNRVVLYGIAGLVLVTFLVWGYVAFRGVRTIGDLLQKNEKLKDAILELTSEKDIGYAKVLGRKIIDGKMVQEIRFVEPAWSGSERVRDFDIPGEVIYFDAMVVKFESELVLDGKERALYVWRRIYSESLAPEKGYSLEVPGEEPGRYRDWLTRLPLKERQLFWSEIWDLSNNPNRLEEIGVRAVFGNAIYQRMEPGYIYRFKVNSSGQIYPMVEVRP